MLYHWATRLTVLGHITLLGIVHESHEPFLWCFLSHFGPNGFRRTRGWVNDDRIVIKLCPSMRKVPFDSIEVSTCQFLSCCRTFDVSSHTQMLASNIQAFRLIFIGLILQFIFSDSYLFLLIKLSSISVSPQTFVSIISPLLFHSTVYWRAVTRRGCSERGHLCVRRSRRAVASTCSSGHQWRSSAWC